MKKITKAPSSNKRLLCKSKNVLSAHGVYSKKYGDPCFTHMHDVDLTTNLYENSLSAENCNPFLIDYADVLKLTFITESFARTQLLTG